MDDPDDDLDELDELAEDYGRRGWTPPLPPTSRHRDPEADRGLRLRISWRAGLVLIVAVVILGACLLMRSLASAPTAVPERPTQPSSGRGQAGATSSGASAAAAGTAPQQNGAPGPTKTAAPDVLAHVVGAVATPGVVRLTPGARVGDAVTAAGGALPDADLTSLNLARVLTDGEQVVVPTPGQAPAPAAAAPAAAGPAPGAPAPSTAGHAGATVNLNTATEADLDALPGIGPVLATRIVEWRTTNGNFTSVDELGEVSGIGDKLLDKLRPKVSV